MFITGAGAYPGIIREVLQASVLPAVDAGFSYALHQVGCRRLRLTPGVGWLPRVGGAAIAAAVPHGLHHMCLSAGLPQWAGQKVSLQCVCHLVDSSYLHMTEPESRSLKKR